MTRSVLHTTLSTIAALALATTCATASFAADGDNSGKPKSFKFVAPKAQFVAPKAQFVAPKAPVAQFVPPKAGRDLGNNGGSPTTVFRLTPKAPVFGSNNGSGSGSTTAQFVAPKAKKSGGGSITAKFVAPKAKKTRTEIASTDTPAKPLLLAPASAASSVAVDQAAPAPKPVAEATPAETTTTDAGQIESATPREVALAYLHAAQRYGYGTYAASYSDSEDYGSYDESGYDEGYDSADYSDDNCR